MPTFATPGPIAATVEVAGAQVRVTASDRTDTVMLVECELHMASGQVQLDRIVALQASIASGEVAIGHIAGRATIDGGAFAMRIGEVNGTVGFSNSAGRAGSATPRPTSISAAAAATSTSTAPTAASPPRPPAAPFGSAG